MRFAHMLCCGITSTAAAALVGGAIMTAPTPAAATCSPRSITCDPGNNRYSQPGDRESITGRWEARVNGGGSSYASRHPDQERTSEIADDFIDGELEITLEEACDTADCARRTADGRVYNGGIRGLRIVREYDGHGRDHHFHQHLYADGGATIAVER